MPQKKDWVDFRELRQTLQFPLVLRHYLVKLKEKGTHATGLCPLPTHVTVTGRRRTPSFSVDLERGIWQCFGCHAKGNVLDFCCRMEGFNPGNPTELREGALKARSMLNGFSKAGKDSTPRESQREPLQPPNAPTKHYAKVLVNPHLDFELQNLDYGHPYLRARGFTDETIRHFGLGYCNRGMLKHRIVIQLHDPLGRLVGYAGRLTNDREISETNPKYRFPSDREREGVLHEFRKSHLLYNAHRIAPKVESLVIVEGFASVWWLSQHGYRDTVGLLGSDCSEEQAKLILDKLTIDAHVYIVPDGDPAGEHCAETAFKRLAPFRFTRWIKLKTGEQPTDLSADELEAFLTF